jgi:ProP effector
MPDKCKNGIEPTIEAALVLLCELFPKAFVRYEARRRPLKIGIHRDLQVALADAITDIELGCALRLYVANRVYRSRLVAGAARIDLDGNPAGTVSAEHACAPMKPTPKPKPKPVSDSPPVKRLSLQDLREAARRRKERQEP